VSETTPLGTLILSGVTALGSLAALWGVLMSQRRQPYEHRLITAQTDEHEAGAESKAVEASHKAVDSLSRALDRAESLVARREVERAAWEARERLLEGQLLTETAKKVCAEARVAELEDELRRGMGGADG
jgi:hypothetical protein